MSVMNSIKSIIAQKVYMNADFVRDEYRIIDDLGADSLSRAEIYMDLEKEFGISLPEFIDSDTTVRDVYNHVQGALDNKKQESIFMSLKEYNRFREKYAKNIKTKKQESMFMSLKEYNRFREKYAKNIKTKGESK